MPGRAKGENEPHYLFRRFGKISTSSIAGRGYSSTEANDFKSE